MTRAFAAKSGCSVPSTPALDPDDYIFDSCGVPHAPDSAFSMGHRPGPIPQPTKKADGGCIVGYLVVGMITYTQENNGPPSTHKYKARDCHGCLTIDEWTTPMNAWQRPLTVDVDPARSEDDEGEGNGDLCLMGYWCDEKVLVVWEKEGSSLPEGHDNDILIWDATEGEWVPSLGTNVTVANKYKVLQVSATGAWTIDYVRVKA